MRLALLILLILNCSFAYSCTCDFSLSDDFKESDLILIIEIEESFDGDKWKEDLFKSEEEIDSLSKVLGYHVQAKILKTYKGTLKSETIEIKGDMFFSCAQEFRIRGRYLVFLDKGKKRNQFLTSVCHHNIKLNETDPILDNPRLYFKKN